MSIDLDFYRFSYAAEQLTHAYIQLAKAPFSWAGEKASDWTKYPIAFAIIFAVIWLVAALLSLSEYPLWATCVALWFLASVVAILINFKDGNMKKGKA